MQFQWISFVTCPAKPKWFCSKTWPSYTKKLHIYTVSQQSLQQDKQHFMYIYTVYTMRKIKKTIKNAAYFAQICCNNLLLKFVVTFCHMWNQKQKLRLVLSILISWEMICGAKPGWKMFEFKLWKIAKY